MRITQPALDPRNLFGFADPTPAAACWEVFFVTIDELAEEICSRTGEKPSQVKHLVRAWIRDGLLPKPKIVPVPGRRGTRGDYGDAVLMGYFIIKGLRPRGKPVSIMTPDPVIDGETFSAWAEYQTRYMEWLHKEKGFTVKQALALESRGQLPIPPHDLERLWGERLRKRRELLAKRKPNIRRLRLNTETLARLLPIARGKRPQNLEDLYLYHQAWGEEPPKELKLSFDKLRLNASELYLMVKAIREIWKVACEEETGKRPSSLEILGGDVTAYHNAEEVWRLSESRWRAMA